MIIEFTSGQIFIGIGLMFLIAGILNLLLATRNTEDRTAEKILFVVLSIFGIIFIVSGLNIDYGFIVFKMIDNGA